MIFTKKKVFGHVDEATVKEVSDKQTSEEAKKEDDAFAAIKPKNIGKLDMVIAFDTTGSMSRYIDAVRSEVASLIPQLFDDNEDLRLGIVAFGDYCDMTDATTFGDAYQCLPLTNNKQDLIKFVVTSKNTYGGDSDEFYELVIKKIVEETEWREGSTRSILLIADANPHELGYTYKKHVINNQIDWRMEAKHAADMKIKIDTVSITGEQWYKELSDMTNGVCVPFKNSSNTSDLLRAAAMSRGSEKARLKFDDMCMGFSDRDEEMEAVLKCYKKVRDDYDG
jgi:hypothetical protein